MNQLNQQAEASALIEEVLKPLYYADIFDFPLNFDEIYRFLEVETSPEVVQHTLDEALAAGRIIQIDGYYSLAGRNELARQRQDRARTSEGLWVKGVLYGRWIASLPFIKMVSITGSLAVNNPRDGQDDIDYLIITQPKRLWLCRALIIALVRYGLQRGVTICPNYILTENVLYFEEENLYAAREIVQMVPIYGEESYLALRRVNTWITNYLPHSTDFNLTRLNDRLNPLQRLFKKTAELLLNGFIGDRAETLLQRKQINKHRKLAEMRGALDHVVFTADMCKGHYDNHSHKTLEAYHRRVNRSHSESAS
jgi:hypothetical protein